MTGPTMKVQRHIMYWIQKMGVFLLGPMEMRTGDPFGLYTVTVNYPATTTLMVMPSLPSSRQSVRVIPINAAFAAE